MNDSPCAHGGGGAATPSCGATGGGAMGGALGYEHK